MRGMPGDHAGERAGRFPYIWATDAQGQPMRLIVAEELVRASEERLQFWRQLKDVALQAPAPALAAKPAPAPVASPAAKAAPAVAAPGYEPCWVDTPECKACDECIKLAPGAFEYNSAKKAVVTNPKGASFADIVMSAEKCTAGCLHPGTPWRDEPGLEQLRTRAAKFN